MITVYSTKGDIMFNSSGQIQKNIKGIKKNKSNKKIIHDIFEKMKDFLVCDEKEYWDDILSKCSRNMFPNKNFKFINNILFYKFDIKKYREKFFINEEDLENNVYSLIKFFKSKGIRPVSDINEDFLNEKREVKEINDWKKIKDLKHDKILNYIEKLKNEYNLNENEYTYLKSLLFFCSSGNILNNDNILVEKGNITQIKDLCWDVDKRRFFIDISKIKIKFNKKTKKKNENNFYTYNSYTDEEDKINKEIESLDFGKQWEEYLKKLYE